MVNLASLESGTQFPPDSQSSLPSPDSLKRPLHFTNSTRILQRFLAQLIHPSHNGMRHSTPIFNTRDDRLSWLATCPHELPNDIYHGHWTTNNTSLKLIHNLYSLLPVLPLPPALLPPAVPASTALPLPCLPAVPELLSGDALLPIRRRRLPMPAQLAHALPVLVALAAPC